ncbi:MAG: BREX-1 system adenine-specific DNA-methyltransferase PglX [bacterium]|nr:BREX-1 system adenine-specific DNA-methyltransferase PglX [bacterium]
MGGYRVFEQTVDTCIVLFKKLKSQELLEGWKFSYCIVPSDCSEIIEYIRSNYRFMEQNKLSDDAWTLADDKELVLKEKIERVGKPLKEWDVKIYRGVLTGFNEAFIIDTQTRNRILANCRTEDERKRTEEIIKPVLRGRDIHKWRYKWEGFWIIKIEAGWTNKHCKKENPEEFFKNIFSSLYNYFLQFKDYKGKGKGLLNRDDQGDYWWELRHCDYYSEFEKEKIVWQRVTKNFSFCFVPKGLYTLDSIAFMTGENLRFILGILNSKVIDFYVKTYVHQLSDTGFLLSNQYVERIPIPIITLENEEIAKRIEILVNKIIDITSCKDYESDLNKQSEVKTLENEINALVYKLYNLTTEEIQIIEKNYN